MDTLGRACMANRPAAGSPAAAWLPCAVATLVAGVAVMAPQRGEAQEAPGTTTKASVAAAPAAAAAAAAPQTPAAPENGDTRDDPSSLAGFRVYFAPLRIWIEPDVFWYRWADEQKAFLWNGAAELPTGSEVTDGNMFIIDTEQGGCLLVRRDGNWRKAGEVYGWSERLRNYAGCADLSLGDD